MLLGAVGDALGFPVEAGAVDTVDDFVEWKDGPELVRAGEYSDDTQLKLAVARSIWNGRFHPEYFAYVELPLWIYYQRGAGRASRKAALNLFSPRIQWYGNFYMGYKDAAGSGAVMRLYPLVVKVKHADELVEDVFKSVITTHGHPVALASAYVLTALFLEPEKTLELAKYLASRARKVADAVPELRTWQKGTRYDFWNVFDSEMERILNLLERIDEFGDYSSLCKACGEYDHPGRADSVVLCAAYLFKKEWSDAVFVAANERGTDTDTIAAIVGDLIQHHRGIPAEMKELIDKVQDGGYISSILNTNVERNVGRGEAREWAQDYERSFREGKLPSEHPIFGKLEMLEDRGRRRMFRTEEGQSVLL